MKTYSRYKSFPLVIVAYRALLLICLLGIGIAVVMIESIIGGIFYALFVLTVVAVQMISACARCDYHGARCDTGISVLTRLLMKKKSDRASFTGAAKRCLPLLIAIIVIPLGVSITMIVLSRSGLHLALLAAMIVLFNLIGITNKKVVCPRCRMNDICPLGKSVITHRVP